MKIKKSLVIEAMNNYADLVLDQIMTECCEKSVEEECPCKNKDAEIIVDDEEENETEEIPEDSEEVDEGFMGSLYQAARPAAKAAKNKAILKHAQKVGRQVASMNR